MVHRLLPFLTLLATAVLLGPSPLWPHGGDLDRYGCHGQWPNLRILGVRWLALSRIVTTTNLCEEYLTEQVYPRF